MITICVMSDLHGRADRLNTYAKEMAQLKPDILIDNGDFWQGSLSSFYYDFVANKPNPMFELANEIGVDALIYGNHEFNETVEKIEERQAQCDFPWISCNIGDFAKPYIIKEVQGKRVGIIGATTARTPIWDEQQFTKDIRFERAAPAVKRHVEHLRHVEQVDYVIVCYHGGFSESLEGMWPFQADAIENEANDILAIDGIDVLVTGHQHLEVCTRIGEMFVIQPGANGECFGKIVLGEQCTAELVRLEQKTSYTAEVATWLQEKIGETIDDFRYQGLLASRLQNHPFVDFIHEAQLSMAKTDLSIVDLLYYGEGGFFGPITNQDVLKVLSRPNVLQTVWLSGFEVRQFLEQVAATFELNEMSEIDFSYNVLKDENPPYLYFFIGGLDYTMAVNRPVGKRVIQCDFKGEPINDEQLYSVCLNSYLATGADFEMFKEKQKTTISKDIIPLLLLRYIKEHSPIQHTAVSHFKVINLVE